MLSLFKRPSVQQQIAKELEEAKLDKIRITGKRVYYDHMTTMLEERIQYLERELRDFQ